MIHRGRVLRPTHRTVHHIIALGTVLAANILDHPDVAVVDNHIGGVVVAGQDRTEVGALGVAGEGGGVVGGPC